MGERIDCDVLVAGTGASGFAAALTARHHGLSVILAEKTPLFGGTTAYSAGVVWIPGNAHAQREGLRDSREAALTYLQSEAGPKLDAGKAEAFVRHAAEMIEFMERHTRVRYSVQKTWADYHPGLPGASQGGRSLLPEPFDGRILGEQFSHLRAPLSTMMLYGGMSVSRDDIPHLLNAARSPRSALHVAGMLARYALDRISYPRGTRVTNGNALIARMAKSAMERGIPIWLSSPLEHLLLDRGNAVGAMVKHEGRNVEVNAKRGVVLACGGFPRNDAMRKKHFGHVALGQSHQPLAPEGNTGDGIRVAMEAGAKFTGNAVQPAAWTPVSLVPQPDGSNVPYPHFIDRCKPGYIAVDRRGRRFANEADSYHDFMPLLFERCKSDSEAEAWIVCDHRAIRRYGLGVAPPSPGRLEPHLRSGYIAHADTLEALAGKLGIDGAGFVDQIARYNRDAERGEDPQFNKGTNAYNLFGGDPAHKPNPCVAPLVTPPFYALRIIAGDLGTFIGIATDGSARVLREDGRPVPGLYAVGNDQASVMGGTYPGAGITLGPAMTFGYIAGKHLANEGH